MNEQLHNLIGQATERYQAAESTRESERLRAQREEYERDAERFRIKVKSVLGKEVLDAIGLVTFRADYLNQSMAFVQNSRNFRLQQVTGYLVQLQEGSKMFGNQFNLQNPDARDSFLRFLGFALNEKE